MVNFNAGLMKTTSSRGQLGAKANKFNNSSMRNVRDIDITGFYYMLSLLSFLFSPRSEKEENMFDLLYLGTCNKEEGFYNVKCFMNSDKPHLI